MCGIIGFVGAPSASNRVISGLRRLEYRGYDSAGIAVVRDGALHICKGVGCIDQVCCDCSGGNDYVAIGHTRWATHGAVTQANAHPHTDTADSLAVVHNGIIENYEDLRSNLIRSGVVFRSETDSEIIPLLLAQALLDGAASLEDAVKHVCGLLKGSYAFAAVSREEPATLVGVRNGNPLVVGYCGDGFYLSSDALAFAEHASSMVLPANGDVVTLTPDGAHFSDTAGRQMLRTAVPVDAAWSGFNKNGHSHYMLKEILEQPDALLHTLHQDDRVLRQIATEILRADNVILTACGSSRHACLLGRLLLSHIGRKMSDVVMAAEFECFSDSVDRHTVVIAVSQSGETADVLDGVRAAKKSGARIISLVNRPSCVLADESDHIFGLSCGAEIGVAATKSFLCEVGVFYLLAHAMANRLEGGRVALQEATRHLTNLLKTTNGSLKSLMAEFRNSPDMYFIGRGMSFPLAIEGALKMKEVSYIHAEGMPSGELKHGSLALIEQGTPVVAICPKDETYVAMIGNAMEAKARGAYIIGVSDLESAVFDAWIPVPTVSRELYPFVLTVPLQLMAYYMAVLRGCNPDRPRNLAKSVTVR